MSFPVLLLSVWIVVALIQLGLPLVYFGFMLRIAKNRDYHLHLGVDSEPTVSVLIPTYNEARVIERKLDNVMSVDYPKNKMEVIVVDSASSDSTAAVARRYLEALPVKGLILEESERRGKAEALNLGLSHASGELICSSDAECEWDRDALRNATRYFSDPTIGSISGVHQDFGPQETISENVESSYRAVYRTVRIGESKIHSTPIAEGEIQLFRKGQMTRFDPSVGGDDTCAALCMIEKGFRSISAEDVMFWEPTPPEWRTRLKQKIRRGQHVLQAFFRHKNLLFRKSTMPRPILAMEFFLYTIGPILFVPLVALTIVVSLTIPLIGYLAAATLIISLFVPGLRTTLATYLTNNLTMLAAMLREASGDKQLKWNKIQENRPPAKDQPAAEAVKMTAPVSPS